jgi:hemerythrin-like domain-containing protein
MAKNHSVFNTSDTSTRPYNREKKVNTTSQDAIVLLKSDHQEAKDLFKKYEKIKEDESDDQKMDIAKKVCAALLIHMEIEEKIFYPRIRQNRR